MESDDSLAPMIVNGRVYTSIFDDTDRSYHADALTGRTPADDKRTQTATATTKANTPRYKRGG